MTTTPLARRTLVAGLLATALATSAARPAVAMPDVQRHGDTASQGRVYNESVAVRVVKGLYERGDTAVVDRFVRSDYVQHNPLAPDGPEALKLYGTTIHQRFPEAEYDVRRVIAEGDLVLLHSNAVDTPGTRGRAIFDIFRFQDGKIAEHWDAGQLVPETTANGNDMFSTVSRPRTEQPGSRRLTVYNKQLVTKVFDRLLVRKDLSAVDKYLAPDYHQHSPGIPDGAQGTKAALGAYFQQFPQLKVEPKRVVAEGDLVGVHSHYIPEPGERGQAVFDLFRVRNGKIVEHWDVVQDVPETSANDNTMF